MDLLMTLSDFVEEPETRSKIALSMIIIISAYISVHCIRITLNSGINIKNCIRKAKHRYRVKKASKAKLA